MDHQLRQREEVCPHEDVPADEELAPDDPALPHREARQRGVPQDADVAAAAPDAVRPEQEEGRRPRPGGEVDPGILLLLGAGLLALPAARALPRRPVAPGAAGVADLRDERQHGLHFLSELAWIPRHAIELEEVHIVVSPHREHGVAEARKVPGARQREAAPVGLVALFRAELQALLLRSAVAAPRRKPDAGAAAACLGRGGNLGEALGEARPVKVPQRLRVIPAVVPEVGVHGQAVVPPQGLAEARDAVER
mmetsp:Transcript_124578/g.363731  ORF Transcript_124578/g.363731 Transcript_124578/m.363731 type:complete len:252 (-) Transcript_124578:199-954(-)